MIKAKVRKTRWGYKGYVVAYDGKRKMWSENVGIERPKKEDAMEDAILRKEDLDYINREVA